MAAYGGWKMFGWMNNLNMAFNICAKSFNKMPDNTVHKDF